MKIPKFLLGDNTDFSSDIFIIHTDFPRFILNLVNDEIEWLEDFSPADETELEKELPNLIQEASNFYDREMQRYKEG